MGIPQDGKDTTLFGFKQKDEERFKYHGKKELLKYEKERNIKLFSIVNENTRFGDTAFFIQAPADGCYNRWTQDCKREDAWRKGERMKRIEASYSAFKGENIWVSLSFKMTDDWEIGKAQAELGSNSGSLSWTSMSLSKTVSSVAWVIDYSLKTVS